MTLPTLYKRTSKGAIEQWSAWADGDRVVTEYGLVGGKLQQSTEIAEPKNVGKANATTAEEQAIAQARSEWEAKRTRKGYTDDLVKAESGGNDGDGGMRPMLAQPFSKHGDKLVFPLYAQPKLDGIRCIAIVDSDGVTLWSREQKRITAVPHIAQAVAQLGLPVGTVLDGELYNHSLRADFEQIVSSVRKSSPVDDAAAKLIQYHIYDIPRSPLLNGATSFHSRAQLLTEVIGSDSASVTPVETVLHDDKDSLLAYFDSCRSRGYEGAIARAMHAPYEEGKRSYHLQKLKEFDEAEFAVVGVEEGIGKMAGLAIFVCTTVPGSVADGCLFRCKMEGALDNLRQYLVDESLWRGKKLTVKYQGLTGKAKVPRFPVGKTIRDYE